MLKKCTFLVGIVVGLSLLAGVGCSSDGDGEGGGEGTALSVDGETGHVYATEIDEDDVYNLRKFVGLNERTCQNQKPIVSVGDASCGSSR